MWRRNTVLTWSLLGLCLLLAYAGTVSSQVTNGNFIQVSIGTTACTIRSGSGSPEASVLGKLCDLYIRSNGVLDTSLYVKTTGTSGTPVNTGWFATAWVTPLYDAGNSSTAWTANWNNGHRQYLVLTGNSTATFSNPIDGYTYTVTMKQDAMGGRTVTWPVSVIWPAGTPPTLGSGAEEVDICTFQYVATLAKYFGACSTAY